VIFPRPEDRLIAELLRALPEVPAEVVEAAPQLLGRADIHGLGGVFHDALRASGASLAGKLERAIESRTVASELDYHAHLAMLDRVDAALMAARCPGAVLKGVLLARRLYSRPSARATTDIDLLVDPATLDAAEAAVRSTGYEPLVGPREDWFREHHHHLHFAHPHALPMELHFHAYRGFGRLLPSRPLLDRSVPVEGTSYRCLRVLAPEDELVYLAVHAAAHRFTRLAWLYDCKLLLATMTEEQVAVAAERARAWGYARPLELAALLLVDVLGAPADRLVAVGELGTLRRALLTRMIAEPGNAVLRSATRFVYTTALASTPAAAARYATAASLSHARRLLGRGA
jgi:hypothetical protein